MFNVPGAENEHANKEQNMRVMEYNLPFTKAAKWVTVLATSCWHRANPAMHIEGVMRFIERAKKHPWKHHGDGVEGVLAGDKRFAIDEHKEPLLDAIKWTAGTIESARKTCIGYILGNHDYTPSKEIGDVGEYIAMCAGVPYLTATCFIRFQAPEGECVGFFCHGTGTAQYRTGEPERKTANRQVKLRDILKPFHADICGMGHMHTSIVTPPCLEERLTVDDDDKVKRRPVIVRPNWYYAAPSMFMTYPDDKPGTNYAEMRIYPAKDLGWIEYDIGRDGTIYCVREVYETGETKMEHEPTVVS